MHPSRSSWMRLEPHPLHCSWIYPLDHQGESYTFWCQELLKKTIPENLFSLFPQVCQGEAAVCRLVFWSPFGVPNLWKSEDITKILGRHGLPYVLLGWEWCPEVHLQIQTYCGNTRTTFTWWTNGSQWHLSRRSSEPSGGARAFATWSRSCTGNILKSIICIALRVRMLEWSWLLCRETLQEVKA